MIFTWSIGSLIFLLANPLFDLLPLINLYLKYFKEIGVLYFNVKKTRKLNQSYEVVKEYYFSLQTKINI